MSCRAVLVASDPHPRDGRQLRFEAPPPAGFRALLARLRG
jgi:hypothetical protein